MVVASGTAEVATVEGTTASTARREGKPADVIERKRVTDRLTYANVVATLALFIALGGIS